MPFPSRLSAFFFLALFATAAAGTSVPVQRIEPLADGEDETTTLYFELDDLGLELVAATGRVFDAVLIHPRIGDVRGQPTRHDAPPGRSFDPDRVYLGGNPLWVFAALRGEPAGWWLLPPERGAEPVLLAADAARIEGGRFVLAAAAPELAAQLAALPARAAWREAAWQFHHAAIEAAHAGTVALLDTMRGEYVDAAARDELAALLARTPQALDFDALPGVWKVRSLQGDANGLFAYPWFRARIEREGEALTFRKTSGSQRRSGRLYPYGDGESGVFLGGATVNDDPERAYSRQGGGFNPEEGDSVGRLYALEAGHLLLLLDVVPGEKFEVYELRR